MCQSAFKAKGRFSYKQSGTQTVMGKKLLNFWQKLFSIVSHSGPLRVNDSAENITVKAADSVISVGANQSLIALTDHWTYDCCA